MLTTVLRPINGMMPEASKIGSVGANRVFSGNNIFYEGFAGFPFQEMLRWTCLRSRLHTRTT